MTVGGTTRTRTAGTILTSPPDQLLRVSHPHRGDASSAAVLVRVRRLPPGESKRNVTARDRIREGRSIASRALFQDHRDRRTLAGTLARAQTRQRARAHERAYGRRQAHTLSRSARPGGVAGGGRAAPGRRQRRVGATSPNRCVQAPRSEPLC